MSKPSKFSAIFEQGRRRGPEPDQAPPADAPVPPPASQPDPPAVQGPAPIATTDTPPALPSRGPGRPRGKRSDPDFEQVTAYLPSALYTRVRIALMEDGRRQDFSGLMADLLTEWSNRRGRE